MAVVRLHQEFPVRSSGSGNPNGTHGSGISTTRRIIIEAEYTAINMVQIIEGQCTIELV
jgi:hypothetical protein